MEERSRAQQPFIDLYRTDDCLTVAALLRGIEPSDIVVEVTTGGWLVLHSEVRRGWSGQKEVLVKEWSAGKYHCEVELPAAVDGPLAVVTYGNDV